MSKSPSQASKAVVTSSMSFLPRFPDKARLAEGQSVSPVVVHLHVGNLDHAHLRAEAADGVAEGGVEFANIGALRGVPGPRAVGILDAVGEHQDDLHRRPAGAAVAGPFDDAGNSARHLPHPGAADGLARRDRRTLRRPMMGRTRAFPTTGRSVRLRRTTERLAAGEGTASFVESVREKRLFAGRTGLLPPVIETVSGGRSPFDPGPSTYPVSG